MAGVFFCPDARHLSRRRCVGFAGSLRSLTHVSFRGFSRLPPSCNTKSLGHHKRHLSRRRCVGCTGSPRSLTHVSSRGSSRLPPSCNTKALGHHKRHLSRRRCVGFVKSRHKKTGHQARLLHRFRIQGLFFSVSSKPSRRIDAASSGLCCRSSVSASQA